MSYGLNLAQVPAQRPGVLLPAVTVTFAGLADVASLGPVGAQAAGDLLVAIFADEVGLPVSSGMDADLSAGDNQSSLIWALAARKVAASSSTTVNCTGAVDRIRLAGFKNASTVVDFTISKGTGTSIAFPAKNTAGPARAVYWAWFVSPSGSLTFPADPAGLTATSTTITGGQSIRNWHATDIASYAGGTGTISPSAPWIMASMMVK